MKKRMTVLLAVLLIVSLLAACGGEPAVSGTVEPVTQATTLPEETTEATEATEGAPLEIGRLQGGVYTNTYLGITCTLDESWTYQSAQELQQLPENIEELLQGTQVGDYMTQYTQLLDMKADNQTDLTGVNVVFTKMSIKEQVAYALMDDQGIVESTLSQKDLLIESYTQAGMPVEEMEMVTVQYLGKDRPAIRTKCTLQGVPYYVLQVFEYQKGSYGATITASSFVEDKTQQALALFQPLQ